MVAAILFLIALFLWVRTKSFVSEALKADGIVIGFDENNNEGISYAPVVRFTATGGRVIEFTDSVYSNPPGYKVGERIKIFYHRQDFKRARIAAPSRLYFAPGLLMFLAATFAGIGLVGCLFKIFY